MNKALLRAAKKGDVPAMKALADSLEERGDILAAAAWRAKAGLCRVVYQVVNTETGEVEKEYGALTHCEQWIKRYEKYEDRRPRQVRVLELLVRRLAEIKPRLKDYDARLRGPVEVVKGEFAGASGEAIGRELTRTGGYHHWVYQVAIGGVVRLVDPGCVEFLP